MCAKRCFTKAEAEEQLAKCAAKRLHGNARRQEYRIYWCRRCSWWHLSSHEPPKR